MRPLLATTRGSARWPVLAAGMFILGAVAGAGQPPLAAQGERWSFPTALDARADASAAEGVPGVALDRGGALHAVWLVTTEMGFASEVAYARRTPKGAWTLPTRAVAADGVVRAAPAVAVSSQGDVHVAWVEHRGNATFIAHRVRGRASGAWSRVDYVDPVYAPIGQGEPRLAADLWGNVHVVWTDHRGGTADVYHSRLSVDGPWSPGMPLCNPTAGDQRAPALAVAPSGDLYAAWEDTRDGRSRIYASRLPPGGLVWWPNSALSLEDAGHPQRGPAIAVDGTGAVHVAWVDPERAALRAATLRPAEPFWDPDRRLYTATRGPLLDVALAGGPGSLIVVAWGEDRADGARIYAAPLDDTLDPERVDVAPQFGDGRSPALAIGADAVAYGLWTSVPRAAPRTVVEGHRNFPPPDRSMSMATGAIAYVPLRLNCHRDGFVLRDCDDKTVRFLTGDALDLAPFLGAWVNVDGVVIDDDGCPRLVASGVHLATSPCPTTEAGVTGWVTANGAAVDGALVQIGGTRSLTGTSGRFYAAGLPPGTYGITATARCALPATLDGVSLGPRQLAQLPPASVSRGDVNGDCRIDVRDLVLVAANYRRPPAVERPCLDLDLDGVVGLSDLAVVAAHFGRGCPESWSPMPVPTSLAASSTREGQRAEPNESARTLRERMDDWRLVACGRDARAWEVDIVNVGPGPDGPLARVASPAGVAIVWREVAARHVRLAAVRVDAGRAPIIARWPADPGMRLHLVAAWAMSDEGEALDARLRMVAPGAMPDCARTPAVDSVDGR